MKEEKIRTIEKLFEGKKIRSIWDKEKDDYYFSVVDVISVLTESLNPKRYWSDLKIKLTLEGSQVYDNIVRLKLKAQDGKYRLTDTLDTEGIFRLIQSIPSPKAEIFKLWLAKLGRERIDETFDSSLAIDRAIDIYRNKGYTDDWIEKRLKAILHRKELTDVWKSGGIEGYEYAILTNEIYKTWSGMNASEYKEYKGIRKESLRDNMSRIELILTDLGEEATKELAEKYQPKGLKNNKDIAHEGGSVAKDAKDSLENKLGETVVVRNKKLIETNERK